MLIYALLNLLAVACWEQSDIRGTFVSNDGGCQDASELHFGADEVFVKRYCALGQDNLLFRGHWYRLNQEVILQGRPGIKDTSVPFQYISNSTVRFGNSLLSRATQATSIDTLALVGYGYYSARDPTSTFKRALFTEGKMTLFFKDTVNHGPWEVTAYNATHVSGTLASVTPVTIVRLAVSSLQINGVDFDKENRGR